jgi:hypothetical protein
MTAPGVIFTDEISRKEGYHLSEIMKAVYEKNYALNSLKHVFVLDIKNANTKGLLRKKIYTDINSLGYPGPEKEGKFGDGVPPSTRLSWALKSERSWHILF